MTYPETLSALLERKDLSIAEAEVLMGTVLRGELSEAQLGGLLIALVSKGAAASELAGFAIAMLSSAERLDTGIPNLVDTCGTGGGPSTFNLSTGAAIVAAAAGAKIAKHGNRAVTSKCGSADVLEALGVRLDIPRSRQIEVLERVGIVFLFAPNHHPAMRHVGPTRKALGVRTVFNQLGPLANPAGATRQLIGVYDKKLLQPMAEALCLLGTERAYVVHSEEGMDEISPCGKTFGLHVTSGQVESVEFSPKSFEIEPVKFSDIAAVDTIEGAKEALLESVTNAKSPRSRALLPNASIALMLAGVANDPHHGADLAREAIMSGASLRTIEELVKWTS